MCCSFMLLFDLLRCNNIMPSLPILFNNAKHMKYYCYFKFKYYLCLGVKNMVSKCVDSWLLLAVFLHLLLLAGGYVSFHI